MLLRLTLSKKYGMHMYMCIGDTLQTQTLITFDLTTGLLMIFLLIKLFSLSKQNWY